MSAEPPGSGEHAAAGHVTIIGAGPAGLAAAERLGELGYPVRVYERMPSPARKFLIAGRGGLNLTHSEPVPAFMTRYGDAAAQLGPAIAAWPPSALREWAAGLGEETFIGSSGRVFPRSFKASPLLRAWLARLGSLGLELVTRHDWRGFTPDGALLFATNAGEVCLPAGRAVLLALGGASWPKLGSNGAWTGALSGAGIRIAPLRASNCGVDIGWSVHFAERFAGTPLKRISLSIDGASVAGEAMVTQRGLEGGAVYALSRPIRAALDRDGHARLIVDLRPDLGAQTLAERLARTRGKQSLSTYLRKAAGIPPVAIALLREAGTLPLDPSALAERIKALPLEIDGMQGLERAISSSGGIILDELNENFMLCRRAGVFAAGEMLDWDAPTGGYLLQASISTGRAAAEGTARWLAR